MASHFVMSGGNILTLQKLLGHSTLAMTQIYAHLHPDHMATEMARLSFASVSAGVVDLDAARRVSQIGAAPIEVGQQNLVHHEYTGANTTGGGPSSENEKAPISRGLTS
jgi:hypothetical protein